MKYIFSLAIILFINTLQAQTDYNLKNGFIAEGYDVVSYFGNKAVKGNDLFISEFEGVKYRFSSAENLTIFNTNPEMYVPQYGGFCAYAVAEKGEKVAVNPKSFQILDNKLYLFYDKWGVDTLKKWNKEGNEKLKKQADSNWKNIVKKK